MNLIFILFLITGNGVFSVPQEFELTKRASLELSSEIDEHERIYDEVEVQAESRWKTLDGNPPKLMAHRGSKAFLPEHTLGAYELAAILGADYVEPDLVLTKDGHFVCFHDLTLGQGTDVALKENFAHLKSDWTFYENGKEIVVKDEWFIFNFTLDEIKDLTVKQKAVGIRPQYFNFMFEIPTFKEYLELVNKMSHKLDRPIGIIPEIKNPEFHNEIIQRGDHYMEDLLIQEIESQGYPVKSNDAPTCHFKEGEKEVEVPCGDVILQSFERESLKYLKTLTDLDLLLLVGANVIDLTNQGVTEAAAYAKHYHVLKEFVYLGVQQVIDANHEEFIYNKTEVEKMGGFVEDLISKVHGAGMQIGIFTVYDSRESSNLGCSVKCVEDLEKEFYYYFDKGIDELFVENMAEAREMRMQFNDTLYREENKEDDTSEATTLALKINALIGCLMILFYSFLL